MSNSCDFQWLFLNCQKVSWRWQSYDLGFDSIQVHMILLNLIYSTMLLTIVKAESEYLYFKLHNIEWSDTNTLIFNNSWFIPKDMISMFGKAREPSAFHVVMSNLFPAYIQFLQSFENLSHYLTRMSSRLLKPWNGITMVNNDYTKMNSCDKIEPKHIQQIENQLENK